MTQSNGMTGIFESAGAAYPAPPLNCMKRQLVSAWGSNPAGFFGAGPNSWTMEKWATAACVLNDPLFKQASCKLNYHSTPTSSLQPCMHVLFRKPIPLHHPTPEVLGRSRVRSHSAPSLTLPLHSFRWASLVPLHAGDWVQNKGTATTKWGDLGDWDVSVVADFTRAFSQHRNEAGASSSNSNTGISGFDDSGLSKVAYRRSLVLLICIYLRGPLFPLPPPLPCRIIHTRSCSCVSNYYVY